ncbi:uncharacterized membrane protein HdeD (DUF308 family) [Stackebrandtia albiflava]|uniref:Uncharacterized membrane protein HdeD (DUF308 family) n=1 Tax=Stackebrandtia albiflava TaxID=406432 RepID=A0A562VCT7_9ACTN|nr:HdeD family acid-resistance protein [Stackebrandtia albiflava]TWJ15658.1 uncharacterized membrane protein HdeD (DUF308 family) [Stackebrandtia albiflava]
MRELLGRTWGLVVFRGVIGVIFGALALLWPQITLLALVVLFGAYAIVDGVMAIVMGFSGRGGERWVLVAMGLVGVLAGLIAFVWPGVTALVLLWVIAFWAVLTGVMYLVAAWRLRREIDNEWLLGLTGVASIGLGVVLLFQPAAGAVALVVTIGVFAIVWGVLSIVLGLRMRGVSRREGGLGATAFG